MDFVAKITLVASVIMLGYNLYQLFANYESVCAKVDEFKQLAKENDSDKRSVQRSNVLLTGFLSLLFIVLVFLANLAYWFVGLVVAKMLLTNALSYMEIEHIFKSNEIDKKFFGWTKVDAAANVLTGLAVAIVVVS